MRKLILVILSGLLALSQAVFGQVGFYESVQDYNYDKKLTREFKSFVKLDRDQVVFIDKNNKRVTFTLKKLDVWAIQVRPDKVFRLYGKKNIPYMIHTKRKLIVYANWAAADSWLYHENSANLTTDLASAPMISRGFTGEMVPLTKKNVLFLLRGDPDIVKVEKALTRHIKATPYYGTDERPVHEAILKAIRETVAHK